MIMQNPCLSCKQCEIGCNGCDAQLNYEWYIKSFVIKDDDYEQG